MPIVNFELHMNHTKRTKNQPQSSRVAPLKQEKKLPLLSFLLLLAHLFFTQPMTNPFLLFLGGFYSQRRGLQGAASRVFWQLVCKWGGCLGGCSCRKQGEEKGKVMGKWGDGSLHGRRKGKVMGEGDDCRR